MTTTDPHSATPPPQAPPPAGPTQRRLRRSRTDRVGAGVAGGLGEYFGVDPVLFRVLFAVAAFFGGTGVIAYVVAWAVIPEQGTTGAGIDRWIDQLRRRRIPVWLVVVAAGVLLWCLAFSWWAPGPFFPVLAVVIFLVVIFGRRGSAGPASSDLPAQDLAPGRPGPLAPDAAPPTAAEPVNLRKGRTDTTDSATTGDTPAWVGATRSWVAEARQASRERRRRAFPVKMAILAALVAALTVLGVTDAATGVALPAYFWVTFAIVLIGLFAGIVLRRTPWSMTPLLVPAVAGLVAFGGTSASLHDGTGTREWTPSTASALHSQYRLAFGRGTLDLRDIGTLATPRTVDVRMAAGQVRLLLPPTLNATVHTDIHIGLVTVDNHDLADRHHNPRWNDSRVVRPPVTASGAPLTINVHLADGNIRVDHTP